MNSATLEGASAASAGIKATTDARPSASPSRANPAKKGNEQSFRAGWEAIVGESEEAVGVNGPSLAKHSLEVPPEKTRARTESKPHSLGRPERRKGHALAEKGSSNEPLETPLQTNLVDPSINLTAGLDLDPQVVASLQIASASRQEAGTSTANLDVIAPNGSAAKKEHALAVLSESDRGHVRPSIAVGQIEESRPSGVVDALEPSSDVPPQTQPESNEFGVAAAGVTGVASNDVNGNPSALHSASGNAHATTSAQAELTTPHSKNDEKTDRATSKELSTPAAPSAGQHADGPRLAHRETGKPVGDLANPVVPAQTTPALAQDLAIGRVNAHQGSMVSPGEELLSPTGSSPDLQQTFTALDSGNQSVVEAGRWVHAGRTAAEAGFDDPSLGWVGIRAELRPSGINASVVLGSVQAAQSLGAHLPGLNAYLSEHHTPVETLTVAAPTSQWSGQALGQQAEQHDGQRGGHNPQQRAQDPVSDNHTARRNPSTAEAATEDRIDITQSFRSNGSISVIA
jgi:hypothetical protein